MFAPKDQFAIAEGTIIQLPGTEAVKWMKEKLETSSALQILHNYFSKEGYTFHIERAKVFVNLARDVDGKSVPNVLGILPSYVTATSSDPGHFAVGISVHDSGYALATGVNVNHEAFGVTEFTLYEVEPGKKTIKKSMLSADEVNKESVDTLAARLHSPALPNAIKTTKADIAKFTVVDKGNQGLLIGSVLHQLLADTYSKSFFPPEYANALSMQTPTFQKFAFATSARYGSTVFGITLSSSSSTSSNACTSTSSSTIEI